MTYTHCLDRPTLLSKEWVADKYSDLEAKLASAEAHSASGPWLELYSEWNELKSYIGSEGARRRYAYAKDMRNAKAEEFERVIREEVTPVAEKGDAALLAALLASRHRGAVAEEFGEQLLRVLEVTEETLAPENSDLRVRVGDLAKQYDKLVASGEVDVLGETLTLARARSRQTSELPEVRRAAFEAYYGWFLENRDALAQIFHDQVQLRDEMAKRLGHANFVPLGYSMMERTDYGTQEAAAFRDAVRKYASPLLTRLSEEQASLLGQDDLPPWDAAYHPGLTLPSGVAQPIDQQLDKMGRVFERLSPKLSAHFQRMREEDLIDLENRKGKGAGAFCTGFSDEQKVAIFCNSTGDESDVKTLAHEMGHAFQGWESQWIESVDLRWPSSDACEIHSMGMEFLSLPHLDEFFSPEHHARYTKNRWRNGIGLLCYVCLVDEFQHWVYENPQASTDDRDAAWIRIRESYGGGIDWSGPAAKYSGTRWYAQLHIYRYPFYYIDYAIAETGAMQLGMLDAQDHDKCLEVYFELCRLGGTQSLTQLVSSAGLRSPFDPELMKDLMAHAGSQLGISV